MIEMNKKKERKKAYRADIILSVEQMGDGQAQKVFRNMCTASSVLVYLPICATALLIIGNLAMIHCQWH